MSICELTHKYIQTKKEQKHFDNVGVVVIIQSIIYLLFQERVWKLSVFPLPFLRIKPLTLYLMFFTMWQFLIHLQHSLLSIHSYFLEQPSLPHFKLNYTPLALCINYRKKNVNRKKLKKRNKGKKNTNIWYKHHWWWHTVTDYPQTYATLASAELLRDRQETCYHSRKVVIWDKICLLFKNISLPFQSTCYLWVTPEMFDTFSPMSFFTPRAWFPMYSESDNVG